MASNVKSHRSSFDPHKHSSLSEGSTVSLRARILQEIIETSPRSHERGIELRRAATKWGLSIRTLQRWSAAVEGAEGDISKLGRKVSNKISEKRVFVSRTFDREFQSSVQFDPNLLPSLQEKVDQLIRAAWASPAQRAGWKQVRREVLTAFGRYLQDRGIALPERALTLSQRRIREARFYRIVDVRNHDRKNYDDHRPRILRRNDMLAPMQQIVMDVKVIDCAVTRADGSTAWPRMVAFMDTGTQRLFRRFFLLEKGEAIRQEHVAGVFLEMASDPLWGFPQQLYRDNGSEFFILDLIREALNQLRSDKVPTIINARPYSAASKPIESRFAVLDRFVFSQMEGWTGGNRLKNKIKSLGKPPAPYPGSFSEFIREADERISILETVPIGSGPSMGKSPAQILESQQVKGWRALLLPPDRLDAAFCSKDARRVSRGYIRILGNLYRHARLVSGQMVRIAIPWRKGALPLVELPDLGWQYLEPCNYFPPTSQSGIRESDKRKREYDAEVSRLEKMAGTIDLKANHRDRLRNVRLESPPDPVVDPTALYAERSLGRALSNPPTSSGKTINPARSQKHSETAEIEKYLAKKRG